MGKGLNSEAYISYLLNKVRSLVVVGREGINSVAFNKLTYQILGSY